MKEPFVRPELEILLFAATDVIHTSEKNETPKIPVPDDDDEIVGG